ncbi:FMN-binding negative transcriptional regulator [Streptomyces sp. SID2888]|uniref:FMN-binding negative transcriptional regulator n=1 Tax=Streptomyces sp. SID2888 TaxID=2690256 RepID=UPI00136B0851|nr:FMN-binding negative transcriptional regulator [Streptomyces sp. SID2888]MYV49717.1 FMN-binding negative transcriptional regulator [Streptomyces sp. SID2888]
MLEQTLYAHDEINAVRCLIRDHAWATLVSSVPRSGIIVSHLPVILDPERADVTVLGHLARTDAELHQLGEHDTVLVIEGPNGYISPSVYQHGPYVPTWNFVVAHIHGRPEPLGPEDAYGVLEATVDHFESQRPKPWSLHTVEEYARHIAPDVTAFRLNPTRIVGKAKLSQEKPPEVALRVIAALDSGDDAHRNPELADAMRRILRKFPCDAAQPPDLNSGELDNATP